jgi:hypothetical protein
VFFKFWSSGVWGALQPGSPPWVGPWLNATLSRHFDLESASSVLLRNVCVPLLPETRRGTQDGPCRGVWDGGYNRPPKLELNAAELLVASQFPSPGPGFVALPTTHVGAVGVTFVLYCPVCINIRGQVTYFVCSCKWRFSLATTDVCHWVRPLAS